MDATVAMEAVKVAVLDVLAHVKAVMDVGVVDLDVLVAVTAAVGHHALAIALEAAKVIVEMAVPAVVPHAKQVVLGVLANAVKPAGMPGKKGDYTCF